MKKFKGFSLIELMVVIAIVALLAAIAVPAYSEYRLRAKLSALSPTISSLKQNALQYANEHGVFPSASQLGYATDGSGLLVTDPTQINPSLNLVYITEYNACANLPIIGQIFVGMDATNFGQSYTNYWIITTIYEDQDGVIHSFCHEGDGAVAFDISEQVICPEPPVVYDDLPTFLQAIPGCN